MWKGGDEVHAALHAHVLLEGALGLTKQFCPVSQRSLPPENLHHLTGQLSIQLNAAGD